MILKEFQKVFDIDNQIARMHQELFDLYKERASIVTPDQSLTPARRSKKAKAATAPQVDDHRKVWAIDQYERLANCWQVYKIKLPTYKKLEAKLLAAYDAITVISGLMPELQGKLGVLAVPPKNQLVFPVNPKLRQLKKADQASDMISSALPKAKTSKEWRLLVAYTAPRGLYLECPQQVIDQKLFHKADYDLNGLGLLEYAALSLQEPAVIDDGTWTALLKDYSGDGLVPYATFENNRYRFEIGSTDNLYGNVRLRPAMEVKL